MEKFKQGAIIGKFMPVHAGHQHLVETARARCERLTVLVCTLDSEPLPGRLRYEWAREMFPGVSVVHVGDNLPSHPDETPNFWTIWKNRILEHAPGADVLFSSESYGDKLSKVLGCAHVCVDPKRRAVPISGTRIGADPYANWRYIGEPVRAHYAKRVCIVGSESTGKTTLAQALARRFSTEWVPEHAIEYLKNGNSDLHGISDMENIARGQSRSEELGARKSNRVVFCDTDLMTTAFWSRHYFGDCPEWIVKESFEKKYDLTLLADIDIPWKESPWRDCKDRRKEIHQSIIKELALRGREYVLISGHSPQERLGKAAMAVRGLFGNGMPWLDK